MYSKTMFERHWEWPQALEIQSSWRLEKLFEIRVLQAKQGRAKPHKLHDGVKYALEGVMRRDLNMTRARFLSARVRGGGTLWSQCLGISRPPQTSFTPSSLLYRSEGVAEAVTMPAPVVIKAGVIAVSIVVAAGVAIYESPELRRMAEDFRRRIAIALHSLGDSISPQERENLFNRPEDAEGFLQSRGIDIRADEQGLDADEETRRRQREELMYWNAIAEEKRKESEKTASPRQTRSRGSSFDDFLKEDASGEKGTFVFNSGAEVQGAEAEGLKHRGVHGLRDLNYSAYTNPFADEHGIDENIAFENSLMDPEKDEVGTDIYSVSHNGREERETGATLSTPAEHIPNLVDVEYSGHQPEPALSSFSERELGPNEFMTAGQDDRHDAYSSIQAWAQTSDPSFYSPLPTTPAGPLSEPELISDGQLTPTDSASLAGSGEDIGEEARSTTSQEPGRYYDVMSDDEDMMTPASWTEVGSVVSESDAGAQPTPAR
ncbi:hypothetical protein BJ170DRAFT_612678 [Xylariales sp. AK1849]|nr:hypothetical protein BJ170DRAFT_612678 [Xylariales sp. AK1849]